MLHHTASGVECWQAGSPEAKKVIDFLENEMGVNKIRFPQDCGIAIKPVSREGTQRLVRAVIHCTIDQNLPSLTPCGNRSYSGLMNIP